MGILEEHYKNIQIGEVETYDLYGGGVCINWVCDGIGFGQLYIEKNGDHKVKFNSECMSKEFVKAVLNKLVDDSEVE